MVSKSEKKKRNDNKTTNPKSANPITMDVDPNMHKPVRGLPNI
jgi:heme-binding NEAT domain protein